MFKIEKVEYKNGYAMVPTEVYRDEHLDPFCTGVLSCILQCNPNKWILNPKTVAGVMCCGEDSVTKAFNRLEANGHLERVDRRNEKGYKLKPDYTVHPISTGVDYYFKRTGKKLDDNDSKYRVNQSKKEELSCRKKFRELEKNNETCK